MEGVDTQLTSLESMLLAVPGGSTPFGRIAIFGGLGTAVAYFVRPGMSFNEDGSPRPWIVTDSQNPQATLFPYWAYTVVPAALFGIFV